MRAGYWAWQTASRAHNQQLALTPESPLAVHHKSALDVNENFHRKYYGSYLKKWLTSFFFVYWAYFLAMKIIKYVFFICCKLID